MKIRKARPEDAKRISALRRQTLEKINLHDYPRPAIDLLKKKNSPKSIIEKFKTRKTFVLMDKGRILGSIDINLKTERVSGLYIDHRHLGKGYGSKLMRFIEDFARANKIRKINLNPTKTSYPFYKKLGYKLIKRGIWEGPGFRAKDMLMEKKLR